MYLEKSLLSLVRWNHLAARGLVTEPQYSPYLPNTGIECPSVDDRTGRVCQSHLWDLPFKTSDTPEGYRWVACRTCGWVGLRRIAKAFVPRIKTK
jgi:hypothetical protein